MAINPNSVTAIATAVYGLATLLLVFQIWRDRVQREKQFREEAANRKLNDLRSAFYDAVGYWAGHTNRSIPAVDALQVGRVFEALTRLECQLRLNDYKTEAHDLGFAVRKLAGVDERLEQIGVVLGLFTSEYRQTSAVGLKR